MNHTKRRHPPEQQQEKIPAYDPSNDAAVIELIARNIAALKREKSLGTPVDASMIEELEAEYRKLAASRAAPGSRQRTVEASKGGDAEG